VPKKDGGATPGLAGIRGADEDYQVLLLAFFTLFTLPD
jgi:hypothetical protein